MHRSNRGRHAHVGASLRQILYGKLTAQSSEVQSFSKRKVAPSLIVIAHLSLPPSFKKSYPKRLCFCEKATPEQATAIAESSRLSMYRLEAGCQIVLFRDAAYFVHRTGQLTSTTNSSCRVLLDKASICYLDTAAVGRNIARMQTIRSEISVEQRATVSDGIHQCDTEKSAGLPISKSTCCSQSLGRGMPAAAFRLHLARTPR